MAHSSSNVHQRARFDVSLWPHDPGFKPSLYITSIHFQQPNLLELMRGDDQQSIDLESVVQEFSTDPFFSAEQKILVAKHLENLAWLVRQSVGVREGPGGGGDGC